MTTKYEELHSSVEDRVGFTNKAVARLQAEVVNMLREREFIVAKAVQLLFEVQCVPWLAIEAKKLHDHLSALETAIQAKVLKGDN